jgi:hypothetical protein
MFLFLDPYVNTLIVKDFLAIAKQMSCSRTPVYSSNFNPEDVALGKKMMWDGDLNTRSLSSYKSMDVDFNDELTYVTLQPSMMEEYEIASSYGLDSLYNIYIGLMHCAPTPKNMDIVGLFRFPEVVSGFIRGEPVISHRKQILKSQALEVGEPKFAEILTRNWKEIFQSMYASGMLPNWEEYLALIPKVLTSNSSGGYMVDFTFEFDGQQLTVSSGSKIMVFLARAGNFIDKFKEWFENEMTEQFPGVVFTREVPSRKLRPVFGVSLYTILAEACFGDALIRFLGDLPDFTVASESGRITADHAVGLYTSCRGFLLSVLTDYSSYDQTQKYENVRKYMIKGMQEGLPDGEGFGPWKSMKDLITQTWTKLSSAYFYIQ